MSSENPRLRYVPRPASGDIDDYGIRDCAVALEKPEGVYRIVVIGDSYVFGLCIDDLLDTFPKRLEAELSDPGDGARIEVVNLGVSGYAPGPYRCDDGHPNERGHGLAARVIADHLRASRPW